jgi:non-specific serine/threonine protein kinase
MARWWSTIGFDPAAKWPRWEYAEFIAHIMGLSMTDPGTVLPIPLTPLVGREECVAAAADLLLDAGVRLVTLTGPGGIGKTRLAIAAAERVEAAFPDGVWFAALAPIADPSLVASAIGQAVGVREAGADLLADRIQAVLRDGRHLLVIDNFEHVLDAAPLVANLLGACPGLTVLSTSRVRLRISGEHEHAVPPLGLVAIDGPIPVDAVAEAAAVRLFVARAQAVRADFALTAENASTVVAICRRVDGLPLAIELAAARIKVLPALALLERLDRRMLVLTDGNRDQPPRLRAMRDAIEWSYDLLTPEEQRLFRRLSVFAGGFTLEAAGAVVRGASDAGGDLFAHIATLVEANLLRLDTGVDEQEPRYTMLETIRDFGLEQLAESGEEAVVRDAHAAWCMDLAEEAEQIWFTDVQRRYAERLDIEHDNLRAALTWLDQSQNTEAGVRLAAWLSWFWFNRNHFTEGRGWLERALVWSSGTRTIERVRVLKQAASFSRFQGDLAQARIWAEESVAMADEIGDAADMYTPLSELGAVVGFAGDLDRSRQYMEAALAKYRALSATVPNAAPLAAQMLTNIAWIDIRQGDLEGARHRANESLGLQRAFGFAIGVSDCLFHLALIAYEAGERAECAALCRESLQLGWAERMLQRVALPIDRLAILSSDVGYDEPAVRLFGAAERLHERIGLVRDVILLSGRERALSGVLGRLGEEGFAAAWEAGRALPVEEAVAEAERAADALIASSPSRRDDDAGLAGLTPREREVLRLLVAGQTDREIAAVLFVSPRTVGTHVSHILAKLEVETRRSARAYALQHGLD